MQVTGYTGRFSIQVAYIQGFKYIYWWLLYIGSCHIQVTIMSDPPEFALQKWKFHVQKMHFLH